MSKMPHIGINEKNKPFLIGAGIALLTLVICFNIIGLNTKNRERLSAKIAAERQKIALRKDIASIEKIENSYAVYMYDKADAHSLRDIISRLARESEMDITSIKAIRAIQIEDIRKVSVESVLRGTYNQLGLFIEKVETLPQLMKIDSIRVSGDVNISRYDSDEDIDSDTMVPINVIITTYSSNS